jgi:methionyl-tRNA formyltransferase
VWKAEAVEIAADKGVPPGDLVAAAMPGTVVGVDRDGIVVATGHGALRILELQASGRKRMPAADFARGARLRPGALLGVEPRSGAGGT